MPGVIVGSASVTIVPDAGRFGPDLKAALAAPIESIGKQISQQIANAIRDGIGNAPVGEPASRTGGKAGARFADSFKARVKAALASMPDVQIGAATNEAEQKIKDLRAELLELSGKKIGVDIDAAEATAQVDRIRAELDELARESPDIAVKADITRASVALAAIQAEVDRLKDEPVEVNVGAFTEGFTAKVNAAIKAIPDIEIGANASDADVKLAEIREGLLELSGKRIGIDIDESTALAEIDRLKAELDVLGAESPSVRVQADTAAAAAKLAEIQAQVAALSESEADVNVSDGGSAGAVSGDLFGLSTLLIGLVPLAAPVGAALVAALMGVATAAAAALGGIGVLALGIMAVSKAVGLLGQQQKAQAGTALASSASQVNSAAQVAQAERALAEARANADNQAITSAEQVKNARLALSQARKDAARQDAAAIDQISQAEQNAAAVSRQVAQQQAQDARSVVDAEHNLAEAARSSANSQQQLNDAREQAARDLESYANNAVDSNLNLQQSQIDLTNAQAQYQADQANPAVTPTQLQQDALNVAKAQQSVVEAQERLAQATEDNNKAQAEGVDNAPGVLSAQQNLTDSLYAQQQAEQSLTDAQNKQAQDRVAGAQQIFDAEQKIREAATARAQTEVKGAQQVLKAEQAVTDALRAQAAQRRQSEFSIGNAQAGLASARRPPSVSAGGGGTGSIASIDAQIAATNPAVLAFAKFVRSTLMPAFNDLSDVAAGGLMPGVEKGFKAFLPILPSLTGFVGSLARTMGDLFAQAGKALNSPFWRQFFGYVAATAGPTLKTMAKIVGSLAKGFAGLMEAFAPITAAIGKGLLNMARGFANFGTGKSGTLQTFMAYVKKEGPAVADMFGKLAVVAGKLIVGLAPLGDVMVKVVGGIADFLAKLSPQELLGVVVGVTAAVVGLAVAFTGLTAPVSLVVAGVVAAAGLIVANWSKIEPIIEPIIDAFRVGLKTAIDLVTGAINAHRDQLDRLGHDLSGLLVVFKAVAEVIGVVLKAAFDLIGLSFALTIDAIGALTDTFTPLQKAALAVASWFSGTFVNFFTTTWTDITGTFTAAWNWVKNTWSGWWSNAKSGVGSYITKPIATAIDAIAGFFGKGGQLRGAFTAIWDWVSGAWSSLWGAAKTGVRNIITTPITDAINDMSSFLGKGGTFRGVFTDAWGWISGAFSSLWSRARHVLIAPVNAARDTFSSLFGPKGTVRTIFNDFVSGVETIWDKLEAIFKKPITFLINSVLNPYFIKPWDKIVGLVGLSSLHIDPITLPKGFAAGTNGHGLPLGVSVVGEQGPELAVNSGGQVDIVSNPQSRAWLMAAGASAPGFADGTGGVLNAINPLHWISDLVGSVKDGYKAIATLGSTPFGQVLEHLVKSLGSGMVDRVKSIPSDLWGAITGAVSGIIHGIGSLFGGGSSPSGSARSIGQKMAASLGWTGSQWSDLDALWNRESGWNYRATNPSSGAYGIPQSLPASKMASAGADWMSNPATQIKWGLGYIAGRYGNPMNAWAHELALGWYDQGGLLPTGPNLTYNGTGQAELIAPQQTFEQVIKAAQADGGIRDVTVYIGDEAVNPRFVKIAHGVVTDRAFAAQQDQRARRPGTTADLLVKNGPH